MISRRWIAICLLACSCIPLISGCWDNREPKRRAYVMGLGIDPADGDPEQITITLQLPLAVRGTSKVPQGTTTQQDYVVLQGTGKTLFDAMQRVQDRTSRELFLGQVRSLLFSSELSPAQLKDVLEATMRNPDIEETIYVAVVQGRAADLMAVENQQERFPALYLNNVFEAVRRHTVSVPVQLWEFWRAMHTPGQDPILPVVVVVESEIALTGIGVFQGSEYRGALDQKQAEGYTYLMGRTQSGVLEVTTPDGQGTVRSIQATRSVTYHFERGSPVFTVTLEVAGELAKPPVAGRMTEAMMLALEQHSAAEIKRRIMNMLEVIQTKYQADVFGLGKTLAYREPEYFGRIRWKEVFPTVQINVNVAVRIRRKGLLTSAAPYRLPTA